MAKFRVSVTQFDLRRMQRPNEFWLRVENLLRVAATKDSQMIVFPEYFTLSWLLAHNEQDFAKAMEGFAALEEEFHAKFLALAKQFQSVVVAGSVPFALRGRKLNRSFIYLPDGRKFEQDKQYMARFETETWNIVSGPPNIRFFEWKGAGLAVALGYDVEFPTYTGELLDKDIDLIVVPSRTTGIHGYWRVRHCSQARAVELQTYMIMSSVVGGDIQHEEIARHYGRGGFFSPCDVFFPEQGVLGLGELNIEGVTTQELDLGLLEKVRVGGSVLNRRDMTEG